MSWLSIITLIFQFGPGLFEAIAALISAIRSKNADAGKAAVTNVTEIAAHVVAELKARNDMSEDVKREQAWQQIQYSAKTVGILLSESECRALAELAYQKAK